MQSRAANHALALIVALLCAGQAGAGDGEAMEEVMGTDAPSGIAPSAPMAVLLARPITGVDVRIAAGPTLEGFGGTWEDFQTVLLLTLVPAVALGAAAAPLIAVYPASGATFEAGAEYMQERRPAEVRQTLTGLDFAAETRAALMPMLADMGVSAPAGTGGLSLDVQIDGFGFVGKPASEHACFFVEASMALHDGADLLYQDSISIAPRQASDDTPPPYCAPQKEFVRDKGALVRQTLKETAVILAALLAARLGTLP